MQTKKYYFNSYIKLKKLFNYDFRDHKMHSFLYITKVISLREYGELSDLNVKWTKRMWKK